MNILLQQITHALSDEQVLAGYDKVAELYPHTPSLLMCRAWEYAAYQDRELPQPVLDVGCGDGRWFQFVWPEITDVSGLDMEPEAIKRALESGVYRKVWQADAASMPVDAGIFATVFANSSLEHMDNIHTVLTNIERVLRPDGLFIFSIFNDEIAKWFVPATLARAQGEDALAYRLYNEWLGYHHLVNPLSIENWCAALVDAGFEVLEHIPILHEMSGRLFLLLDGLWHTQHDAGELGDWLQPYLQTVPGFPMAFRGILQSALAMESNRRVGCGAVLVAKKKSCDGEVVQNPNRSCWCDNSRLISFSAHYLACTNCGTLVSQAGLGPDQIPVRDDSSDFYGREYWFSYQREHLGLPNIAQRARLDLPERCLYWLRTLLTYKLPPARTLELGSSHGAFVGLLRNAGFEATGLELSPWVVDFARQTFDIPMLHGPIEEQHLPEQSFDVIVLNDVLEHLSDPLTTIKHCVALLQPEGLLLIQTPCYPEPKTYTELVRKDDPFLKMLREDEHLYLFSQRAVRCLLEPLGLSVLEFKSALFPYDMYVVVSRQPVLQYTEDQITASLMASPSGHLVQALLDKACETDQIRTQLAISEADRAARLELINRLDQQLQASEADRAARLELINRLDQQLQASEADRAARLAVIEDLKAKLDAGAAVHSTRATTASFAVRWLRSVARLFQRRKARR